MNNVSSTKPPLQPPERGRFWISIRYKILALFGGVLIAAMFTYLLLAVDLFNKDKLAYVYDLNSTLAKTVGEEVRSAIAGLQDKLIYFARLHRHYAELQENPDRSAPQSESGDEVAQRPESEVDAVGQTEADEISSRRQRSERYSLQQDAEMLFGNDADVLAVEVWERRGKEYERVFRRVDTEHLEAIDLGPQDLQDARKTLALPFSTIVAEGIYLRNASLPPDIAILTFAVAPPKGDRIVVADLRPDRFLRIFSGSDIYKIYLVDARGVVLAHPESRMVIGRVDLGKIDLVRKALEGKPNRGVHAFTDNKGRELIGGYSRLDTANVSVLTEIPRDEALRAGRLLVKRSQLFAVGILLAALLVSIFFSRRLSAPLRNLEAATRSVAQGDLDISVDARSRDEVGSLARSFNKMVQDLLERDRRIEETSQQLIQSEKLAAVGEMSAAISHEVKNPLAGMRGFAQLGKNADDLKEAKEYFEIIEKETERAKETLENVLAFTRQEAASFSPVNANQIVLETVRLVAHQMQMKKVALHTELADDVPVFSGNANQIQQVLLNLILNAQHAMEEEGGILTIVTSNDEQGWTCIRVADTGKGIPEDIQQNVFRPFVTTKPKGKGSGLGLSVSKRIVEAHNGEISVQSELGIGTTFTLRFPTSA